MTTRLLTNIVVVVTPVRDVSEPIPFHVYPRLVMPGGTLRDAIQRGLTEAERRGFSDVVVMDAGGSHDPEAIPRLLEVDADLVVGSRFVYGGEHHGSRWRKISSRLYGWLCSLVTMCPVKDWTSGYRVYRGRALAIALDTDVADFHAWQAAVLGECWAEGVKIREVPIVYRASSSSMSPGRALEALKVWWWLTWR